MGGNILHCSKNTLSSTFQEKYIEIYKPFDIQLFFKFRVCVYILLITIIVIIIVILANLTQKSKEVILACSLQNHIQLGLISTTYLLLLFFNLGTFL